MQNYLRRLALSGLTVLGLFAMTGPAGATVITVTTDTDSLDADGRISVREAIQAANTDLPVGDAPAGGAYDVIDFAPALTAGGLTTITLTLGQLFVTDEMTILGPGCELLAISGGGVSRVFSVGLTSATIEGLTIAHGYDPAFGGGISDSASSLVVLDCCIVYSEANFGGGISSSGDGLSVINSTISHNHAGFAGGGIHLSGANVSLDNCSVTENTSSNDGGGLSMSTVSTLTAVHCRFDNNRAISDAAGLEMVGGATTLTQCSISGNRAAEGGSLGYAGIYSFSQSLHIDGCTISNNVAQEGVAGVGIGGAQAKKVINSTVSGNKSERFAGGIYFFNAPDAVMENCTITGNVCESSGTVFGNQGNGGGLLLSSSTTLHLANCIIAANQDLGGETPDLSFFDASTLISRGYNIIGSLGDDAFVDNTTGDQYGDPVGTTNPNPGAFESPTPIDPVLAPLGFSGGFTAVHEPLTGSPAISTGDPATTTVRDQRGLSRPQGAGYEIGSVEKLLAETTACVDFNSDILELAGSLTGWSSFAFDSPLAFADYSATESAIRLNVAPSPNLFRVAGVSTNLDGWLPYADIGDEKVVRGLFWIFAGGQSDPGNLNQIPNLRVRLSNRFAVNSMLEVFHHDPNEGDLGQIERLRETRPSTVATSPSLYRVDFDPVDVPYLKLNSGTEGVLRGAEAYAVYPQDEGYIALAESCIATYPSALLSTAQTVMRRYETATTNAGSLTSFVPAAEVTIFNLVPGVGEGSFGSIETTGPLPVYSESGAGVTLSTFAVPTDRIGVVAREINIDGSPIVDFTKRPRVREEMQYTIRWHLTSTQQTNEQAQVRVRTRTNKFGWSSKLEIGGAWATDAAKTYPLNANNSIAQQALPGIGNRNPDRRHPLENGGWYTQVFLSPLTPDLRAEFPAGTPISVSMPNLSSQPGPGVDAPSRLDLFVGVDLVDTVSGGAGRILESGQVTLDAVEIREFPLVLD